MTNKINNKHEGFTLIELLLYTSLTAIMLLAVSMSLTLLFSSRIKNQTVAEVEQQGLAAMQIITQTIRNADNITAPTPGNTAAVLTLDVFTAASDPTIFDSASGVLRIKEGTGAQIPLTSPRLTVSNLQFQNLSRSGTPGVIKITYTLTYTNTSNRNEYSFSKTFYGTASLR